MKINIAKSAGFCFGVRLAIKTALKAAKSNSPIEMLGDIVHNEQVISDIKSNGIKKISNLNRNGNGKTLLIRAHGSAKKVYTIAKKRGYKIIDATCPTVKEIHRLVCSMEKKGYAIIVIGDKKHDEVKGIVGQLKNKAIIIDLSGKINYHAFKRVSKAAVVVQSTQDIEKVEAIIDNLKKYIKNIKFFNTICQPTRYKQKEIRSLPLQNDVVIVIGSKTSANTKRLYEISKKLNPRTYWVNLPTELQKEWFNNVGSVGITAGASTPLESIKLITNRILTIN